MSVQTIWDSLKDDSDEPENIGAVRMLVLPDNSPDLSYLEQEEFADVRESELERADREGIWGIVGEVWDGKEWHVVDSVWGFIGDDWVGSGYDTDVMQATLDASIAFTDKTG